MASNLRGLSITFLLAVCALMLGGAPAGRAAAPPKKSPERAKTIAMGAVRGKGGVKVREAGRSQCGECQQQNSPPDKQRATRQPANRPRPAPQSLCQNANYVDPAIKKNLNRALSDLKRTGIEPEVTSAWRSSKHQEKLHRCSRSNRCRRANPGLYYALPAGQSLHEAGFAVDISGIASGPRGAKKLTPRGRRIIRSMQKNGFKWKYGLKDPAHFEADPTKYGYRTAKQAISKSQTQCSIKSRQASKQTAAVSRRPAKKNRG